MIALSAYTPAHLQVCLAILTQAEAVGLTVEELVAAMNSRLSTLPVNPEPMVPPSRSPICPHCGTPLVPVANPDGLRIIGCKQCRYSRILEGLNG